MCLRVLTVAIMAMFVCPAQLQAGQDKIFWVESASPGGEWSEAGNWDAWDEPYPDVPTGGFQARITSGLTANLNSAGARAASISVGKNQSWAEDYTGYLNIYGGDLTIEADETYEYIWRNWFLVGALAVGYVNHYDGSVTISSDEWGRLTVDNGEYNLFGGALDAGDRIRFGSGGNAPQLFRVAGDSSQITMLKTKNLYAESNSGTIQFDLGYNGVKSIDVESLISISGSALEINTDGFTQQLQNVLLINNMGSSAISGQFANAPEGTLYHTSVGVYSLTYRYAGDGGLPNDLALQFIHVPEPTSLMSGLIGLALIFGRRRR